MVNCELINMKMRYSMARYLTKLLLLLVLLPGCAYFNTYYMAQKNFKDAERQYYRDGETVENNTKKLYEDAISGAVGIIRDYSDSKYVDDSLYLMGLSYYRIEDYRLALTKFNEIIRAFPEGELIPDALYFKARCLTEIDRQDEARVILNDILRNGTKAQKGRAGIALAELAWNDDSWDELLAAAQNVIDTDPKEDDLYEAMIFKGEALSHLERYEESVAVLEQLQEKKLETDLQLKGNLQLALAKANLGQFDESLEYLDSMQNKGEFAEDAPIIRLKMGKIYELKDDTDTAVETYRKLAGDFPDSLSSKEAWYLVGKILIEDMSDIDAAKEAFDNVGKNKAKTEAPWVLDSKTISVQIDSLKSKLDAIGKFKDIEDVRKGILAAPIDSVIIDGAAVQAFPDSVVSNKPDAIADSPDSTQSDADASVDGKQTENEGVAISAVEAASDSTSPDTSGPVTAVPDSTTSKKPVAAVASTASPDSVLSAKVGDTAQADPDTVSSAISGPITAVPDSTTSKKPVAAVASPASPDSVLSAKIGDTAQADPDTVSSAISGPVTAAMDSTGTEAIVAKKKTADQTSIQANLENRAYLRFSLAELYTFSFDRPDSALTQYRLIIEETPETDYAVRSEYFLGLNELRSNNRYSEETDRALMSEIVKKYPDSKFTQLLKVFLGIIEKPPEILAFTEAEQSRISGDSTTVYLPLFQKVVDTYPGTKSAFQAQFIIAYYTEHHGGDTEKALELYTEISKLDSSPYNREYVALAQEKLKHVEEEPKLLKDIEKNIVYLTYGTGRPTRDSDEETAQSRETQDTDDELTGFQKIRARNVRIRSRYYTD